MRKEYKTTELIDDITGVPADTTIPFRVNGKDYIIDLSEANAAAFNEALAPYIEHARRAPANKRSNARKSRSSSAAARAKREKTAQIRAWATANGYTIAKRGQLSQDIVAAYEAAHATPAQADAETSEN
jgi:hypothetical protein